MHLFFKKKNSINTPLYFKKEHNGDCTIPGKTNTNTSKLNKKDGYKSCHIICDIIKIKFIYGNLFLLKTSQSK